MTETREDRIKRLRLIQMQAAQKMQAQPAPMAGSGPVATGPQANPNGTYGAVPEGYVLNPRTGQYVNVTERAQNDPNAHGKLMGGKTEAAMRGGLQGLTLGAGDEVVAGMAALGQEGSFKENYDYNVATQRANNAKSRQDHPKTTIVSEIGASTLIPGATSKTLANAAIKSGTVAGVYNFNSNEGGVEERLEGTTAAVTGGMFATAAFRPVTRGIDRLFKRAAKRPTLDKLGGLKSALYRRVDASGFKFNAADTAWLAKQAENTLQSPAYADGADVVADSMAALLKRHSGKELTLGALDRIRQKMWKAYNSSDIEQNSILGYIENIDKLISSKAGAGDLMQSARQANAIWSKANLLDSAFRKADLQTAGSGSGGNVLNKYKQAVTAIITNPQKSKWFNNQELGAMNQFVDGNIPQNVMRKIGKLSPNGNGLMLTIHAMGAAINPATLMIAGAGAGAKEVADGATMRGARELQDMVTGFTPEVRSTGGILPAGVAGGNAANEYGQ